MKTNSKWLLNLVNGILTIAWYLNMLLCAIAFLSLTITFITKDYTNNDALVKYRSDPGISNLQAATNLVKTITIQSDQSLIKMDVRITLWLIISAYMLVIMFEALVFITLYNLRKIFGAIKQQQPFHYDNVRRLKITALCLALFTPLNILYGILKYAMLTQQVQGFSGRFMMVWSDSFIGVILGAVIYIMADIFSYGFELKKEVEEFV